MSVNLTREADLAERWDIKPEQFRILRRQHAWAHVRFSRVDVRYTDAQVEQIVRDMTTTGTPKPAAPTGQTRRSARRSS